MMFYDGNREVNKTYSKMQNGERDTSAFEELCHCLSPMPDIGMGNAAVQLDELNVMDFIELTSGRSWLAALTTPRQGEYNCNDKDRQSNVYSGLTHRCQHRLISFYGGMTSPDLQDWPINRGV